MFCGNSKQTKQSEVLHLLSRLRITTTQLFSRRKTTKFGESVSDSDVSHEVSIAPKQFLLNKNAALCAVVVKQVLLYSQLLNIWVVYCIIKNESSIHYALALYTHRNVYPLKQNYCDILAKNY